MKIPEGKFIATVKVGEKGQIVIPKGAKGYLWHRARRYPAIIS